LDMIQNILSFIILLLVQCKAMYPSYYYNKSYLLGPIIYSRVQINEAGVEIGAMSNTPATFL